VQLVDHSVLEKLEEMRELFELEGLGFEVRGLESLVPMSDNELASRKRSLSQVKRLTIMASSAVAEHLVDEFVELGVTSYTISECKGGGRQSVDGPLLRRQRAVRLEVLVPTAQAAGLIEFLRVEVLPKFSVTICLETVEVLQRVELV
jgi:nitrogen regulatory protein PII